MPIKDCCVDQCEQIDHLDLVDKSRGKVKILGMRRGFNLQLGTVEDAAELAALHTTVAGHLTNLHGPGPWSTKTSEKGVLYAMRTSQVFVARQGRAIVGTLRLATKKPWAIDTSYFSKCRTPLYLLAMAVLPTKQRQGLGRKCLTEVQRIARSWPADAIRLDAYDADAGAGSFYARCGYTEVGQAIYRDTPLIYYELLLGSAIEPRAR